MPEITVRHAIDLSLKHLRQLFFIEILCIGIKAHTEYASTAAWRLGYKHGLEVPADCTDTLADDPEEIITPPEQILNVDPTTPVESLNLSRRCLNILKRANIYTVYELISRPEEDFVKIRNIGHSTIVEVKSALQRNGFDFGCVQFSSIREQ